MPAAPVLDEAVPKQVGRYHLVTRIASGGMGSVYLGVARGVGGFERLVAIKVCAPALRSDPEFATMFLEEARLAAKLRHPNIVPTLDVDEGAVLYLVMEYVEGGSLSALWRAARERGAAMPMSIVLRVGVDALNGLHAAHEFEDHVTGQHLGIVHRDVSPHNILVGTDGVSRIVDFGIAKAEARAVITREGQFKAKPGYFAPEQVTRQVATARTDVFTMGIVIWEMLCGKRLYAADNHLAIVHQLLEEDVAIPSTLRAEVPQPLDVAVIRALARDEGQRWASAHDMAIALEGCGVPLATRREVSAYVEELIGRELESRRALLRKPHAEASWDPRRMPLPEVDATAAAEDETVATTEAGHRKVAGGVTPAVEQPSSVSIEIVQAAEPVKAQAKSRWWPKLVVGAIAAGAIAVGAWIATRSSNETKPPTTTTVQPAPSTAPAPTPTPAGSPSSPAPPPAPAPSTSTSTPAETPRHHAPVRKTKPDAQPGPGSGSGEHFPAPI